MALVREKDKIKFDMFRQIGVEGIVSTLHYILSEKFLPLEAINEYKDYIEF